MTREPFFETYAQMMRETGYARFPQEHRAGGTLGVNFFCAQQGPMEMVDPPNAEIAFTCILDAGGPMEIDFNEGWQETEMRPGFVSAQPAGQVCSFRTRVPHTLLVAGVNADRLNAYLNEAGFRGADPFGPLYGRNARLPSVVELIQQAWRAAGALGAKGNLAVDGAILSALAVLVSRSDGSIPSEGPGPLDDRRLARAIEYVDVHLATPLTVGDLAAVACLSPSHFARAFRAATGEAVWAFVQRRRCERAREMLTDTRLPLSEVADRCGFAHQTHMGRSLKARFGVTPMALRRGG